MTASGRRIRFSLGYLLTYGIICLGGLVEFARAAVDPDSIGDFVFYQVLPRSIQPVVSVLLVSLSLWLLFLEGRTVLGGKAAIEIHNGSLTMRANPSFQAETIEWSSSHLAPQIEERWWVRLDPKHRAFRPFLNRRDVRHWLGVE
jgi:hypothetical protein